MLGGDGRISLSEYFVRVRKCDVGYCWLLPAAARLTMMIGIFLVVVYDGQGTRVSVRRGKSMCGRVLYRGNGRCRSMLYISFLSYTRMVTLFSKLETILSVLSSFASQAEKRG